MKEQLISDETSKLFLKKGFPFLRYTILTQAFLQQWLRETHKIFLTIEVDQTMEPKFCYAISKYTETGESFEWINVERKEFLLFYTYEEALEEGLQEALNLI